MIITVSGRPVAKQRARTVNGHTYTPPKTREYEELVAWSCRVAEGERFMSGDVAVLITLYAKRKLTGDVDNYAKCILDGMVKGGVLGDDRQIVSLTVTKTVADTDGALIRMMRV